MDEIQVFYDLLTIRLISLKTLKLNGPHVAPHQAVSFFRLDTDIQVNWQLYSVHTVGVGVSTGSFLISMQPCEELVTCPGCKTNPGASPHPPTHPKTAGTCCRKPCDPE